jgi:parvulin-like peptidyl-prolyl isomerase
VQHQGVRLLLIGVSLFSMWARAQALLIDRIVAVVDLQAITQSAVEEKAQLRLASAKTLEDRAKARKESLTELIENVLITRDAQRLKIDVTDADVDRAFQEIAKQNLLTTAQLETEVLRQGLSPAKYRAMLRQQLLEMKWLNLQMNRAGKPESPDDQGAFLARERARLLEELKAAAVVEVRS